MNATATRTAAQIVAITDDERFLAAAAAKPRQLGQYKATGIYPVTVGGNVVGYVERHAVATSKTATWWSISDQDHNRLDGGFTSRTDAVDVLGKTDFAVETYRAEALVGTFGIPAQKAAQARHEELIAALEREDDEKLAGSGLEINPAPQIPAVGTYARITRTNGFNGRCSVHGGTAWGSTANQGQTCKRGGCGRELTWSKAADVTEVGWVRSVREATNGAPLIALSRSKRSRVRLVVAWATVLRVES